MAELRQRLVSRKTDSAEVIEGRMARAAAEVSHWDGYDYVLVNDDLDATESDLRAILSAERLRRERRPALGPFVRKLMEEPR